MRLTPKAAAKKAGVSVQLIYVLISERRIPFFCFGGEGKRGRYFIEDTDLDAFIASCKVEAGQLRPEIKFTHSRLPS